MHQQILPSAFHQAQEKFAGRHVADGHIETRPRHDQVVSCQRRYQTGLYRSRRNNLQLILFQAFLEQTIALLVQAFVAVFKGLAGRQQAEQAQHAEARHLGRHHGWVRLV